MTSCPPKEHWMKNCTPRLMLPYGKWTCGRHGFEVLFNRRYWPILVRVKIEPT